MKLTESMLRNIIKQQLVEANAWFTGDQRHKNFDTSNLDSAAQKAYSEGRRDGTMEERNTIAEYLREQGEELESQELEELAAIVANGGARPSY